MKSINFEQVKEIVNREPPQTVYKCRSGSREGGNDDFHQNGPDPVTLHTEHPPLFGYRYRYDAIDPLPEPDLCVLNSQHCLNDMVLLRFNTPTPQSIQNHLNDLNNCRSQNIVKIDTLEEFTMYSRPEDEEIKIAVKNFTGIIINNPRSFDVQRINGEAHNILFTLNNGYVKYLS